MTMGQHCDPLTNILAKMPNEIHWLDSRDGQYKVFADISLILLYRTILPMVRRCKNVTLQWDSLVAKYCSLLTCGARLCDVKLHDRFLPGWLAQEASVFAGNLLGNRPKSWGQLFKSPNTVMLDGHGKAEKWRRIGCSDKAELCSSLLLKIQASGVTSPREGASSERRHLLHRKLCTRTFRPADGTHASFAWHSLTGAPWCICCHHKMLHDRLQGDQKRGSGSWKYFATGTDSVAEALKLDS